MLQNQEAKMQKKTYCLKLINILLLNVSECDENYTTELAVIADRVQ